MDAVRLTIRRVGGQLPTLQPTTVTTDATLDAATITTIKGLGGIQAIAISHPHFYTTMGEWARAFACTPIR